MDENTPQDINQEEIENNQNIEEKDKTEEGEKIEKTEDTDTIPEIPTLSGKLRYKLINYIIVAEFDIDTGSEVRIQYPSPPVGYDER